jgi:hypothetical protein
MCHWAAKAQIVHLKVRRPTLDATQHGRGSMDFLRFCNNVIATNQIGTFGGKPIFWYFIKVVAHNLNRKRGGFCFSLNSKSLFQAMKVYGGRYMCDLFSLNYVGPSMNTTKRENKKVARFVSGKHIEDFRNVASIYKDVLCTHDITRSVLVIFAEDETKIKGWMLWQSRLDMLVGFCVSKEGHVCSSNYKVHVGSRHLGYNRILDAFTNDKLGGVVH